MGFGKVYDYVAGKVDWLAHNLPVEGTAAERPTAGRLARRDVATARLDEPVGAVQERVAATPYGFALVTSLGGCLLGRLRSAALRGVPSARAESVMEAGPSTVRPHLPLAELVERMRRRSLAVAIVTTPEGELVGVVRRDEAEARLATASVTLRLPGRAATDA